MNKIGLMKKGLIAYVVLALALLLLYFIWQNDWNALAAIDQLTGFFRTDK